MRDFDWGKAAKEGFVWLIFGVLFGLLPLLLRVGNAWINGGDPDWQAAFLRGEIALPSVTITAGALANLVLRRGIRGMQALLVAFAVVEIVVGTWLYSLATGSALSSPDRFGLGTVLVFVGAVLCGLACVLVGAGPKEP